MNGGRALGRPTRVAVIGGGITGLAAAYRLRRLLGEEAVISVLEVHNRLGGKLKTIEVGGDPIEAGAEAFITRRPEALGLIEELGLTDELVYPSGMKPLLRIGGVLHPMPTGTVMGVPGEAASVRGLVDDETLRIIAAEESRPLEWIPGTDVSVGGFVGERMGRQVVTHLIDPLLGGVYSGSADGLSLRAAIPSLAAALDAGATSLTAAVRMALPTPSPGPLFATFADGYRTLLDALAERSGAHILVNTACERLARTDDGFYVDPVGEVDAVVLAVQAPVAAELLAGVAPEAARLTSGIELAGSVVVGMTFDSHAGVPENSGILVASDERDLTAKAFTMWSRKWPHVAARGPAVIRASFGRHGDEATLHYADADLVELARRDLATAIGFDAPLTATFVQRWWGGIPQHAPGHLDLVAGIRDAVDAIPGLQVAGAYLESVGVPGCIGSADRAADVIADTLGR